MSETAIVKQEQLLMFDHPSLVQRYAARNGIKLDEATYLFGELKKFLYVCAVSGFMCAPSKQIDNIWHDFVLYTKDYQDFCVQFLGGFIHHNPTDQVNAEVYAQTREAAIKLFGSVDSNIWPPARRDSADCDSGCGGGCGN